ncbi:MAG TPA: hypothetical protein PLD25_24540 [Chloroflexota bacterium]|nr:hypothetical protein [Chloroflexota bacterium]HUM70693.1 hypothetical protein [Chloroflexota bacterium]
MTIDAFVNEAILAGERFWFIRDFKQVERTDATVTIHLEIENDLFVQLYFSQRSGRLSLALVGNTGRIYGRDREYGRWHLHPFGKLHEHIDTPEGMSAQLISQFLSEVEKLLIEHDLM